MYQRLIEEALDDLGWDSYEARTKKNIWYVARGTARIMIILHEDEDGDLANSHLFIRSFIAKLPKNNLVGLYRYLLEQNSVNTLYTHFALQEDSIWLQAIRSLEDIDLNEIAKLIGIVSSLADRYDNYIIKEFGATKE